MKLVLTFIITCVIVYFIGRACGSSSEAAGIFGFVFAIGASYVALQEDKGDKQ